jgi:phospholipid/cholesterol/gamma-HCH transport system substrate-binding protein
MLLGFVVLAGLGLGAWVLFRVGDRQRLWAETADLDARFASANGIEIGTQVRVRGIEAGQVVAIRMPAEDDPDGKIRVSLRLDKKYLPSLSADAKARLLSEGVLGGRVINIEPGKDKAHRLQNGDRIEVVEAQDMAEVMQQVGLTVKEFRESNGTIMKLLKSDEAHTEAVKLIKDTQELVKQGQETFHQVQDAVHQTNDVIRRGDETLASIKKSADAVSALPVLRDYVPGDEKTLLYRPDADQDRRSFAIGNLFEPGRAILTDEGKMHLNNLAPWFKTFNQAKAADVVVATYANYSAELAPALAQALTQRQSEVVVKFLHETVKADKTGWFWYSTRKVTPLGMGQPSAAGPERDSQSQSHTDIVVFVPR